MPTSRATRVTSSANEPSWSTIVLIVFFSSAISPRTSTVIFFERSPFATAVVTSAMLRTCSVSEVAMKFTDSVRPLQVPLTPSTWAWPPSRPSVPTSRATRVTSSANEESWSTIVLSVFFSSRISPRASTVIFCERSPRRDGGRDLGDVAHLARQVVRHLVHVLGEAAPRAADAFDLGLAAEAALGADLARDARDLVGERRELVDHRVDRVLQLEDLAARVDGDLLRQVALRDRGRDLGDVAHLVGEVRRHAVHGLGQVAPRAADVLDLGLAAEAALGADLARDARDLGGERRELVDHRVDRVLELEHLALDVDGDLLREVAVRDGGRDVGDVAHLLGERERHAVHGLGQAAPRAADAFDLRLAAELALGADLARDARDLGGERGELVDHRVDRVLELERSRPGRRR